MHINNNMSNNNKQLVFSYIVLQQVGTTIYKKISIYVDNKIL
jgi:hypothetical protein